MKRKVLAYITRRDDTQLLVFRHVHYPEAGVQVPGGTVEANETLEEALHREIEEESGLTGLPLVTLVATQTVYSDYMSEWQERNFFHLRAADGAPDEWLHIVRGSGEDENLHFFYSWLPVAEAGETLIGGRGEYVSQLSGGNTNASVARTD